MAFVINMILHDFSLAFGNVSGLQRASGLNKAALVFEQYRCVNPKCLLNRSIHLLRIL